MLKRRITVTIDEGTYNLISHKPNLSRYVNQLILESVAEEQKDTIACRVTEAVKRDDDFIRFIKVTCDEYMQERGRGEWRD